MSICLIIKCFSILQYQHGRYPTAYPGTLMNTPPQLYSPFNPNNFNYTPHGAANGMLILSFYHL